MVSNSQALFRDGSSKLISGFLSLIRMSDFILLGGLEMRSDLKTDYEQKRYRESRTNRKSIIFIEYNQCDYRSGK